MTLSSVHTSGLPSILKYTNITLNSTFTTTPMMPSLSPNLLQRDVFDYDFNRERIFLEIVEAEIAAMRKTKDEEKEMAVNEHDALDDELAQQSTKLSLSSSLSSTGHQDGTTFKPRSTSEEDVAAAISASLRDY
ncbi:hypothetical protein KXD40_006543 [Peronospora effusa]|uniref:Uncharacterized protein n=1 Tax=Peronospora effusa TaxID=542832 RepID=A0A3M6VDH5_9STRA|nr:hypothetical protein DD238_006777 [Peronospora effusa]RQM14663.1 hypothetical protein DD237_006652 [Peronospora effusa]UIZ25628.1 hypothetical protein KXD40_006543 [Peronospora effusa]